MAQAGAPTAVGAGFRDIRAQIRDHGGRAAWRAGFVRSKNIEYIEGLDHVRAYASLLVVAHHSFWMVFGARTPPGLTPEHWVFTWNPLESLLIETHIVVSLFFVLSGFVFSLAGAGKDIAYGSYMRNRLLRIAPLYLTLLFFGMAVFPERVNLVGFISSATLLGNTLAGANLWPVSNTFWTVAIEMQFYLIFPFLNAFLNREGARPLVYLLLLAIGLRLVAFLLTNSIRDFNYWHLPGRIDSFLLGMIAARYYLNRGWETLRARWFLLALVGFLGATLLLNRLGGFLAQEWWKALWPTVEAVVCTGFVVTYIAASRRLPGLISRALRFLGELSFSTYLIHFMVLQGLFDKKLLVHFGQLLGVSPALDAALNTLLLVIPATLLLAFLSYQGIEAPFMRLRGRYVEPRS